MSNFYHFSLTHKDFDFSTKATRVAFKSKFTQTILQQIKNEDLYDPVTLNTICKLSINLQYKMNRGELNETTIKTFAENLKALKISAKGAIAIIDNLILLATHSNHNLSGTKYNYFRIVNQTRSITSLIKILKTTIDEKNLPIRLHGTDSLQKHASENSTNLFQNLTASNEKPLIIDIEHKLYISKDPLNSFLVNVSIFKIRSIIALVYQNKLLFEENIALIKQETAKFRALEIPEKIKYELDDSTIDSLSKDINDKITYWSNLVQAEKLEKIHYTK